MAAILAVLALVISAVVAIARNPQPRTAWQHGRASTDRPVGTRRSVRSLLIPIGAAAGLVVTTVIAPPVAAVAVFWRFAARPLWRARRLRSMEALQFERSLPYVVDVLRVAASAGFNVSGCVATAGRYGPGDLGERLQFAAQQCSMGRSLADSLDDIVIEFGESVRPLVSVLVSCELDGVSIVNALERLADDVRQNSQRQAEIRARKVPVRLLVPLALGTLPAFVLLILVPVVAQAVSSLRLG